MCQVLRVTLSQAKPDFYDFFFHVHLSLVAEGQTFVLIAGGSTPAEVFF
jgi:hypothetical protein